MGGGLYNAGLWLKKDKNRLMEWLEDFCRRTAPEYCGEYTAVTQPRASLMGIGERVESPYPGIHILGDAANTSASEDGEGISRAVISAAEFSERIGVKKC